MADGARVDDALRLEGVMVTYPSRRGPVRAVDGVDLHVAPGEVLALVGESGCGKTTLVRSVVGLERIAAGRVLLEGVEVGRSSRALRAVRRRVQLVFQDASAALDPRQRIHDAIAEGLRIHRVPGDERQLVAAALAAAGLRPPERFVDRFPHELSGGQRQRVLIAAALALEPRVLLADEPVASLDASVRGELLALLRSLVEERGISIVAVTHDLGLAWNIADRVAVMYLGRVVEVGSTEAVLSEPAHPYTRALLSVVPEIDHLAPQVLAGEPPDASRVPAGCRFHPRCPVVASGEAERRGMLGRCTGSDPTLGERSPGHRVACHLAESA